MGLWRDMRKEFVSWEQRLADGWERRKERGKMVWRWDCLLASGKESLRTDMRTGFWSVASRARLTDIGNWVLRWGRG